MINSTLYSTLPKYEGSLGSFIEYFCLVFHLYSTYRVLCTLLGSPLLNIKTGSRFLETTPLSKTSRHKENVSAPWPHRTISMEGTNEVACGYDQETYGIEAY